MLGRSSLLVAACLIPATAFAQPAQPDGARYFVNMTLTDGPRLVGSPALVIAANEPAEVAIGEKDGNQYRLRFTVAPQADDTVLITSAIDVTKPHGDDLSATPALVVRLGYTAGIALGAKDSRVRVDFRVSRRAE